MNFNAASADRKKKDGSPAAQKRDSRGRSKSRSPRPMTGGRGKVQVQLPVQQQSPAYSENCYTIVPSYINDIRANI